jgi:hypothetical protein
MEGCFCPNPKGAFYAVVTVDEIKARYAGSDLQEQIRNNTAILVLNL